MTDVIVTADASSIIVVLGEATTTTGTTENDTTKRKFKDDGAPPNTKKTRHNNQNVTTYHHHQTDVHHHGLYCGFHHQPTTADHHGTNTANIANGVLPPPPPKQFKDLSQPVILPPRQFISSLKCIGTGGFGKVYEKRLEDGRYVALKVVRVYPTYPREGPDRFSRLYKGDFKGFNPRVMPEIEHIQKCSSFVTDMKSPYVVDIYRTWVYSQASAVGKEPKTEVIVEMEKLLDVSSDMLNFAKTNSNTLGCWVSHAVATLLLGAYDMWEKHGVVMSDTNYANTMYLLSPCGAFSSHSLVEISGKHFTFVYPGVKSKWIDMDLCAFPMGFDSNEETLPDNYKDLTPDILDRWCIGDSVVEDFVNSSHFFLTMPCPIIVLEKTVLNMFTNTKLISLGFLRQWGSEMWGILCVTFRQNSQLHVVTDSNQGGLTLASWMRNVLNLMARTGNVGLYVSERDGRKRRMYLRLDTNRVTVTTKNKENKTVAEQGLMQNQQDFCSAISNPKQRTEFGFQYSVGNHFYSCKLESLKYPMWFVSLGERHMAQSISETYSDTVEQLQAWNMKTYASQHNKCGMCWRSTCACTVIDDDKKKGACVVVKVSK